VIAGYANGTIVIWNIQLYRLSQQQWYGQGYEEHEECDAARRLIQPPSIDNETSVRSMLYDATTETILVAYTDVRNLYQYDIHGGKLLAIMEGHTLGPICAMTWDIEPSFSFTDEPMLDSPSPTTAPQKNRPAQRLVATGDTSGTLFLWPLDAYGNDGTTVVRPLCEFHGHTSPISAIYLDAFKMVSGADDGRIRIWDPLTGELLRTLGFKISRPTAIYRNNVSSMRVSALSCDEHRCVATIGCQVKSWDFSSVSSSSLSSSSGKKEHLNHSLFVNSFFILLYSR
jgi:WD40 repeat protein